MRSRRTLIWRLLCIDILRRFFWLIIIPFRLLCFVTVGVGLPIYRSCASAAHEHLEISPPGCLFSGDRTVYCHQTIGGCASNGKLNLEAVEVFRATHAGDHAHSLLSHLSLLLSSLSTLRFSLEGRPEHSPLYNIKRDRL